MKVNLGKIFRNFLMAVLLFILSFNLPELDTYSWLGIFFFIWLFLEFIEDIGTDIPVRKLLILIALLQWVIAPILSYHFFPDSEFYSMQIPESLYMGFVVPGIFLFHIALNQKILFKKQRNTASLVNDAPQDDVFIKRGYFLFVVGLVSLAIKTVVPSSLSFAFFLLEKLIYVGAFYLLAGRVRFKYFYLAIAFAPLIIGAQGSTVFHDLFLWGGYTFIIYAFINRIKLFQKILFIAAGVFFVLFVQYFKTDYREEVRFKPTAVGTGKILEITEKKLEQEGLSEDYFQSVVDRLNQGWIIARIMYVVPQFEPYAKGETIKDGLISALVPRILDSDKVRSGGAYFERFTKIELVGTSMNLGLIGEAYANYGQLGAYVFLIILGLFFSLTFSHINKVSMKNYEVILWIPFLFLYVVKAEDDFTTMFNQFTKSAFICWFMFVMMNRLFLGSDSNVNQLNNLKNESEFSKEDSA